jgi:hypothetical protein
VTITDQPIEPPVYPDVPYYDLRNAGDTKLAGIKGVERELIGTVRQEADKRTALAQQVCEDVGTGLALDATACLRVAESTVAAIGNALDTVGLGSIGSAASMATGVGIAPPTIDQLPPPDRVPPAPLPPSIPPPAPPPPPSPVPVFTCPPGSLCGPALPPPPAPTPSPPPTQPPPPEPPLPPAPPLPAPLPSPDDICGQPPIGFHCLPGYRPVVHYDPVSNQCAWGCEPIPPPPTPPPAPPPTPPPPPAPKPKPTPDGKC